MDTQAGFDWDQAQPEQDLNAQYQALLTEAKAVNKEDILAVDMLLGRIATSALPESTFKSFVSALAAASGLDGKAIEAQLKKARKRYDGAAGDDADEVPQRTRAELERDSKRILDVCDVLRLLRNDLPVMNLVGAPQVALGCYIASQSRRWVKPIHVAVAGASGLGKSYEAMIGIQLINPDDVYCIGDGSEKFFIYDTTELTGKVVFFMEATPLQRDSNSPLAYATRTLMSEGVARYRYVDFEHKDRDGRPIAQEIERRGPSAVIVTSTADKLHPEIETRLVRFVVDGSEVQTGRILDAMAEALNVPSSDPIIAEWQAFDELLSRYGALDVVIPYATAISPALRAKAAAAGKKLPTRLRRDYSHVLMATKTIAFINQFHRQRDAEGRVVAEQLDWEWTAALFDPALTRGALRALPAHAITIYNEIDRRSSPSLGPGPRLSPGAAAAQASAGATAGTTPQIRRSTVKVPTRELAAACGVDQSTVVRGLKLLVDTGCLEEVDPHTGQQVREYRIQTAPDQARGRQVLPRWAEIDAARAGGQP